MPETTELPDAPIVYKDGRPQSWYSVLWRSLNARVNGLVQFAGGDPDNLTLTADDIEQGIEQRVEQIANKIFTYNVDDTVAQVQEVDRNTGDPVRTKTLTYDTSQNVTESKEVQASSGVETTKAFLYDGSFRIDKINITIAGL